VWTTVHANNAMGILDRMIDLLRETENPNPLDLIADPNIISGLICQRLAKVLCPHCKKKMVDHEDELSEELIDRVRKAVANIDNVFIRGEGCEKCGHAGVKGRSVVGEVIAPDMQFMLLLKDGRKVEATDYWKTRMGGRTMTQHAISKIEEGILDPSMAEETVGPITLGDTSGNDI
jgi:general secretion pathway protein E